MSIVTWANVGVALTSLAAIIISLITWKKRDQQKIERDKKEAYERCNAEYIKVFDRLIDHPELAELYDATIDLEIGDIKWKFWAMLDGSTDPAKDKKLYKFTERIYYLCARVYQLKAMKQPPMDDEEWGDWDIWIRDLVITSKWFRGVHVDITKSSSMDIEFTKHVDHYMKKFNKNFQKEKIINDYITELEKHANIKNTPGSCECKVCQST